MHYKMTDNDCPKITELSTTEWQVEWTDRNGVPRALKGGYAEIIAITNAIQQIQAMTKEDH